ncbi:hypothetical protein GDO81_015598 [Engystomops pustulosus]|uniref:Uncharacterized protein n=1 Tax=Engystomops pustulosus TaxID=76066 RepID=A0AAV7AQ55_ENGPU|nr:hypothetical protein GDO81_015598 [Engystomops pustulosus]
MHCANSHCVYLPAAPIQELCQPYFHHTYPEALPCHAPPDFHIFWYIVLLHVSTTVLMFHHIVHLHIYTTTFRLSRHVVLLQVSIRLHVHISIVGAFRMSHFYKEPTTSFPTKSL